MRSMLWHVVRWVAYRLRRVGLRDLWIYAEHKACGLERMVIDGSVWWVHK